MYFPRIVQIEMPAAGCMKCVSLELREVIPLSIAFSKQVLHFRGNESVSKLCRFLKQCIAIDGFATFIMCIKIPASKSEVHMIITYFENSICDTSLLFFN